jgi:hypothetical protein
MKSLREHLRPEEVAGYASRWLDFRAEHDIEDHAAVCEQCFHVLMDGLWDRIETAAATVTAPSIATPVLVRAW